MPIDQRFNQPQAVAVKIVGVMNLRQPDSIALAGQHVGALLPGRAPPRRAVAQPTR